MRWHGRALGRTVSVDVGIAGEQFIGEPRELIIQRGDVARHFHPAQMGRLEVRHHRLGRGGLNAGGFDHIFDGLRGLRLGRGWRRRRHFRHARWGRSRLRY